ncbi:MAG: zinc-ribbon domain containing protein [Planctomycetes bacterium]|nr:zinc-ribbon domain containing protein [Planctomycetota bacterium]
MIVKHPGQPEVVIHWWDADYEPPLPAGAVRGDITKQNFCLETPFYYYEDQTKTCLQCGSNFVFSAKEQKYWYETLSFHQWSLAIRCRECRRKRRTEAAVHRQVSRSKAAVRARPTDARAQLAAAAAIHALRTGYGAGRIDDGIAAARKAYELDPRLHEALYWEAECQEAAGRTARARRLYEQFVKLASVLTRCRSLVQSASKKIGES